MNDGVAAPYPPPWPPLTVRSVALWLLRGAAATVLGMLKVLGSLLLAVATLILGLAVLAIVGITIITLIILALAALIAHPFYAVAGTAEYYTQARFVSSNISHAFEWSIIGWIVIYLIPLIVIAIILGPLLAFDAIFTLIRMRRGGLASTQFLFLAIIVIAVLMGFSAWALYQSAQHIESLGIWNQYFESWDEAARGE